MAGIAVVSLGTSKHPQEASSLIFHAAETVNNKRGVSREQEQTRNAAGAERRVVEEEGGVGGQREGEEKEEEKRTAVSRVSATIAFSFLTCQVGFICFITNGAPNAPKG